MMIYSEFFFSFFSKKMKQFSATETKSMEIEGKKT